MGGSVTPITSLSHFREIVSFDCHRTWWLEEAFIDDLCRKVDSGKTVVFDFWATWCGPCRAISPVFEKLSSEHEGLEFYKVDIDELTVSHSSLFDVYSRNVPPY